jgi:hypothetical protein
VVVGIGAGHVGSDDPISATDPSVVGPPLLVGIVLVSFGFDLAGRYRTRPVAIDRDAYFELGWACEPPTPEPVGPTDGVETRLDPSRVVGFSAGIRGRWFPAASRGWSPRCS